MTTAETAKSLAAKLRQALKAQQMAFSIGWTWDASASAAIEQVIAVLESSSEGLMGLKEAVEALRRNDISFLDAEFNRAIDAVLKLIEEREQASK